MLALTWEQIALVGRCVLRSRAALLESLLGPLVGAVGGDREYKPGQVVEERGPKRSPEEKDAEILHGLAAAGLKVHRKRREGGANG